MRIAILGGTFDPIHNGHLRIAKHFATIIHFDTLVFMPAGYPWKKNRPSESYHRLEMVRLAIRELDLNPTRVVVSDEEIRREGATYTIDTVIDWRISLGKNFSLSLIMGSDQLQSFTEWKEWKNLLELSHLCIACRPGFDVNTLNPILRSEVAKRKHDVSWIEQHPAGGILIEKDLKINLSATNIRNRIQAGIVSSETECEGVPTIIWHYIRNNNLYRT